MKHKVKVTVIDKKLYPELQKEYCADPNSGECPCYNTGDEFLFERDEKTTISGMEDLTRLSKQQRIRIQ